MSHHHDMSSCGPHGTHTSSRAGHIHHIEKFKKKFWFSLILTVPILLLSEMIQHWFNFSLTFPLQKEMLFLLSLTIYLYGGLPFIKGLYQEVENRQPGMMTLIGTAISIAFFYSIGTILFPAFITGKDFFWELATLIDVMLLGHWIEAKSILGASKALEELARVMPTTAHVFDNGEIVDVPVSQLKTGDVALVRPGEKIPSDGEVVEGESSVNEAFLTGESNPVHKKVGSKVIGGSINGEGAVKIRILKTGEETYIAQVLKLVQQAQESRSRTQDLANRAAALLFYVALFSGILIYIVWFSLGKTDFALEAAVSVLVIACPHALGLAIPLIVSLSTSITAKNGILIRDRKAFEMVKDLDAIVFDKTGTLTLGKFGVTDIISYIPEKEFLELSAAVELNSEHTIASAIVDYARKKELRIRKVQEFKTLPGLGAYGKVDSKDVYVGGVNLLRELGIEVNKSEVTLMQKQGKTVVFTVVDNKIAGIFGLSDLIRPESYDAIRELKRNKVKVFMLTGDSEETAKNVAKELGIDEYFAQVLPDKKAEKIRYLQEKGLKVAMVGDGINDAPALVTADLGIAVGAGTDVAIESADIVLVKNDPRDIAKVESLARKVYFKMVQNLWWAAGYNILAIPLAAGLLSGLGIIISPAVGAVLMSLSTVIVALNSQTLRKFEPKVAEEYLTTQPMLKDPVCGMEVEASTMYKTDYGGKTYYFCSLGCKKTFESNPKKYTKN
ncbi:heavy metal translocating P-type ATPase [Candidatus Bathyarchaeota archaeon]|nr:heavy metal translocating P-type ATPase [Candidatus Bathyarchaeota archaeon]